MIGFLSGRIGHFYFATLLKLTVPGNVINFIFLKKKLYAFAHAGGDVAAALHHPADVGGSLLYLYSVVNGVLKILKDIGTL